MLTAHHENRFTYQDYLLLPEEQRVELIEGDFHMTPSASELHQRISKRLEFRFYQILEEKGEAFVYDSPLDVVLSEENVVQPDLVIISRAKKAIIKDSHISGAPDVLIEILSPHSQKRDRIIKMKLYARHGVREYWIVDPDARSVEVYTWKRRTLGLWQVFPAGSAARSNLFPHVAIEVDSLFAEV